jgi:hypothetical protein
MWVVVVGNDDEEEKSRFISYVYIHIHIWTHMGMRKQIDLASFASLCLLVISKTTIEECIASCTIRFFFVDPYFFFFLFSAIYCTNVSCYRGGENLKIFTP